LSDAVHRRVDILGVRVSAIDIDRVSDTVAGWIERGEARYVCVTGVHGIMESRRDRVLQRIHNESGLTVPDGMPTVWAGRFAGAEKIDRVYGPEMMVAICERARREGWSSFFYGGGPGVADRLEAEMVRRLPGLRSAGTYTPPFRPLTAAEDEEIVERIDASRPQLVWVGLSTPKQERWMAEHIGRLQSPCVFFGVGAAFDVNAGLRSDAPRWMKRTGLQWLHRLGQEPRRLWRRYLVNNPAFVLAILRRRPKMAEIDCDPSDGCAEATP
jgi:N-acetylglucosaminyldiphosphoundecaprenol N-acetyl-beta-D-mannosaminyltransferase